MRELRTGTGVRMAVVGGGVCGSALALALLQLGRNRQRPLEVTLFHAGTEEATPGTPLLLTHECRTRLAALGCRIPPKWRLNDLRGLDVIAGGSRARVPVPTNGLWLVDGGGPGGESGQRLVASVVRQQAVAAGVKLVTGRVQEVDQEDRGHWIVRSAGVGSAFNGVAVATGVSGAFRRLWSSGPVPLIPAVHARLRFHGLRLHEPVAKVWLRPLPHLDALCLIPCGVQMFALAFGPRVEPADLCQALMAASRDGHLPEGFEISNLALTHLPAGAARNPELAGLVAVGPALLGHPFEGGIAGSLRTVSRAATALLSQVQRPNAVAHVFTRDFSDLSFETLRAVRAGQWLLRSGDRAPRVLERAVLSSVLQPPLSPCLLGIPALTPVSIIPKARWAALGGAVAQWFRTLLRPLPTLAPVLERNLYYVVDDDADCRQALTELLQSRGAEVVSFSDELALFASVARRPPNAVFLDVVLPWVDGLRLCAGLKSHPATAATPVYVMTGMPRPYMRARALDAGAQTILAKPIEAEMLWKVLGSSVSHLRTQGHDMLERATDGLTNEGASLS